MATRQRREFPALPDLMTVAQAAKLFGLTKTAMYHRIHNMNQFKNVWSLGDPDNERQIIVLLRDEVEKVKAEEDYLAEYAATHLPYEQRLNEWTRRVKQWGRDQGSFDVRLNGHASGELVSAYLRVHPDDTRPVV